MDNRIYSFTRKNGRQENQDYLFYEKKIFHENETLLAFGVCDGMGGMENGSEIARLTAWTFTAYYSRYMTSALTKEKFSGLSHSGMEKILSDTVCAVQKTILSYMQKHNIDGGSTLTAGVIYEKMLYLINAGDSPCYLINKQQNEIKLISNVQNCAYEGINKGYYTDRKSREFSIASCFLTNFIGYEKFKKPKVSVFPVFKGDLILMGSDGLFGDLYDEEILQNVDRISIVKLLEQIADCAAAAGETDNQSGIICSIK